MVRRARAEAPADVFAFGFLAVSEKLERPRLSAAHLSDMGPRAPVITVAVGPHETGGITPRSFWAHDALTPFLVWARDIEQ